MSSRVCELCCREVTQLTRHHLIPRTRHGNRRTRREFTRQERIERIALLCRPCHNQVHALLTEKELERNFHTLESLRAHPELARFLAWIAKRPAGLRPASRTTRSRRERTRG